MKNRISKYRVVMWLEELKKSGVISKEGSTRVAKRVAQQIRCGEPPWARVCGSGTLGKEGAG